MTSLADKRRASAIALHFQARDLAEWDFDSAGRIDALADELDAEADREDEEDDA